MPELDLSTIGWSFVRLKARWTRQGRRVRQLVAEADKVAKSQGSGSLRGNKRQRAMLETVREELGYHATWARWSGTADELANLVEKIMSQPARSLPELAIKFDALAWLLLADGAVVDHEAQRQVRLFGRELRGLTASDRTLAS